MIPFTPPTERNEADRLAVLDALGIIDSAPDRELEVLVRLAGRLLGCPIAMLSMLDRDRLWVTASTGGLSGSLPREHTFCNSTIRGTDPFVVEDARRDPRFAHFPVVTSDAGARFYAGAPLRIAGHDGIAQSVGTLCVIDTRPRTLTEDQRTVLAELATVAQALIAARALARDAVRLAGESDRQAIRLARQERILLQAERMAMIGSWRFDLAGETVEWSDNVYRIHGLAIGTRPSLSVALNHYPADARRVVEAALARLVDHGETADIETDFVTADGELRRVRSHAEIEAVDGTPVAIVGIVQDVTDQHRLQHALRCAAEEDALTGIANRAAFNRALDAAMARADADRTPLMLALIDLDGFKAVNDTLGHMAGDDVLRSTAARLREPWLAGSYAARLGGDEFALIVEDAALVADPAGFAQRLETALRGSASADGLTIACGGSVGTAFHGDGDGDGSARDFLHRADTALYASKRARIGERRGRPPRSAIRTLTRLVART